MAWTAPSGHVYAVGEVVTAATLNTYVGNNLAFLYGDTTWTAPTYTNSWVDFGAGGNAGGFRLVGTRVVLRGLMKSGTINTVAFTMPVGYRPTNISYFAVASNSAFGMVQVNSGGAVTPQVGNNTFVSLEGVAFDTI